MNREQIDTIVKQALSAHADSLLSKIGEFCILPGAWVKTTASLIKERERILDLLRNDAKRAAIVDALLKEMNS